MFILTVLFILPFHATSRLGSSRNVQWSEKGGTKWVYTRTGNLVNIPSFRSGYSDERTKMMNEIFFDKNEEMYF